MTAKRPDNSLALARRVVRYLTERARAAHEAAQEVQYAAMVGDIASLQFALGEEELAVGMQNESINIARRCGAEQVEANSHFNKAIALARLGRTKEAIGEMEQARVENRGRWF